MFADLPQGSPTSTDALVVDDIVVAYSSTIVLRHVSLSAGPGEVVSIQGANGSGKSTLLRAIAGAVPVVRGDIRIGGRSVRAKSVDFIARKHGLAYLRQEQRGIPDLTVRANLTLAAWRERSYGAASRAADALLQDDDFQRLRLLRDTRASSLSGGERLLLALAMIEITAASLLLLDEPFAGADATVRDIVSETVLRWAEGGRCILIVEHDAFRYKTREVLLQDGRVVETVAK